MEKECSTEEMLRVKTVEVCMTPPCLMPSTKSILSLSIIDNQQILRNMFDTLLLYSANISPADNPVKTIREALSKVLVYYQPLAGRLRKKENGKIEVECTGEGALFVEATAENRLSVLGNLDDLNPSFRQLLFKFSPNTDIEDLHPLVVQVTRFICGGFVVGVSFHHSVCDGRGAGQFLKGLAEMARGDAKPSVEPICNRELLNPIYSELSVESACILHPPPLKFKDLVQASLVINPETIKEMKECIMEECKEFCSTFEIVAALTWRARTKALEVPITESVKLLFAVDVRRSFNPPLPEGYYGNGIVVACALDTVQNLINGSLSHTVKIIKKTKISLSDEKHLQSSIQMDQFASDGCNPNNLLVNDWRRLGFNEVDFGWGDALNVSPLQWNEKGIDMPITFLFLRPPKNMPDGIKIVFWMPTLTLQSFESEIKNTINKYVKNASRCNS